MAYSKYSKLPGDSILTMLEPGEYVLNRNAVNAVGKENLDELNFEDAPRYDMSQRRNMQVGGMLGDMLSMQSGGSATEEPGEYDSLTDIYNEFNIVPHEGQRASFEENWAWDDSNLDPLYQEFERGMGDLARGKRKDLNTIGDTTRSTKAKQGFTGAGAIDTAAAESRDTIYGDYASSRMKAESALDTSIKRERDDWKAGVIGALDTLEQSGGAGKVGWNPPSIDDKTKPGEQWTYTSPDGSREQYANWQGEWIPMQEYQSLPRDEIRREEDKYYNQDDPWYTQGAFGQVGDFFGTW